MATLESALMAPAALDQRYPPSRLASALMPTPAQAAPSAFTTIPPQMLAEQQRPVVNAGPSSNALAEALMASAYQSPNRNWFEAVGNLAKLWSGSRQNEKFAEAQSKREAEAAAAARQAGIEDYRLKKQIDQQYAEPGKPPADVQEYQFYVDQAKAAGQQPLSYFDYQVAQKKAGATSVNVGPSGVNYGEPGEGLVWQRDKDGGIVLDDRGAPIAIPYQGGKAYVDAAKADQATTARQQQTATAGNIVIDDANRILSKIKTAKLPAVGFGASIFSALPGTEAYDVAQLLEGIKANAAFDKLQQMRQASPTGGALGAVSDRENSLLTSAIGSLEQAQTKEQFEYNLQRVANIYLDIVHGPGAGPARYDLSAIEARQSAVDRARDAIRKGAPRDAVIQRLREKGIDPSGL